MKKILLLSLCILLFTFTYSQNKETTIKVKGLCGMCQERIENAALKAGAQKALWDSESTILQLTYNPKKTSLKKIQKSIALSGHDNGNFKAPDDVYNALPGCCQYRQEKTADIVHPLRGKVIDEEGLPMPGALLNWEGTNEAVTADSDGLFTINRIKEHVLVVTYVGQKKDTIDIGNGRGFLTITMGDSFELDEVEVVHKRRSTHFSFTSPIKVETIGESELQRAACCNLSQSFETNPAVETSFTDAITGTRQIKMLGLSGKYVRITRENLPSIRGLEVNDGLTYIPGTWIESIQLSKGIGSVVNGFEGITGQINLELKKPHKGEKLLANLYTKPFGTFEANFNGRHSFSRNWHTGVLLHASMHSHFQDKNKDTFADMPMGENFIVSNRWLHKSPNGWRQNFGIKVIHRDIEAGQLNIPEQENPWRIKSISKGYKAFAKIGKIFKRPQTSLGLQFSGNIYDQNETYHNLNYIGKQKSFYFNAIFQSYIQNTMHRYKTGVSFQYDNFKEKLHSEGSGKGYFYSYTNYYDRIEQIPGAFLEYTFIPSPKFTVVAGIRADYHNAYKLFFTPRLHAKYQPTEKTSFRVSAGKGYHTANILSEYKSILASHKAIVIIGGNSDMPYGLKQEQAWNYGFNFNQKFKLFNRESILSLDFYYTDFIDRVVVQYTPLIYRWMGFWANRQMVDFRNLQGDSYSHNIQVQWDYDVIKNLELRLAYRYHNAKSTYWDNRKDPLKFNWKLEQELFTAKHRFFGNLFYSTENGWGINLNMGWQSGTKMPDTSYNPKPYRRATISPSYFIANFQVSKTWKNRWDIYAGIENVFDYKQKNPIIAADNPRSFYFDASQIWGPIKGREFYVGLRFRVPQIKE